MNLLKNAKDVNLLLTTVKKCNGDVILRRCDGSEEFNLKSTLSTYIAIGELAKTSGDEWEVFCMNKEDEVYFLNFFYEIKAEAK